MHRPRRLHAAMASGLLGSDDETKPRRFDLTMSRRTRRPVAATSATATSCPEQDHHRQAVDDVNGLGLFHQPAEQREDPDGLLCLSDHLQSRQPEQLDAHQEHQTSEQQQCSEDTTQEQQACCTVEDDESEAQQQQQPEEDSRRFSLQELIEDEAVNGGGVKDEGTEENAAAAVRGVAEGAAAAEKRPGQQVPGTGVIGMMRRYVKVPSINPKRASPEKNAAPVC